MAEFVQLLMQMLYRFFHRVGRFTLLKYEEDKLEVNYEEEEVDDKVELLRLQSREIKVSLASATLPTPTPSPSPQTE